MENFAPTVEESKEQFESYDENKDGRVGFEELKKSVEAILGDMSEEAYEELGVLEKIKDALKTHDKDGDGLDFDEFYGMLTTPYVE